MLLCIYMYVCVLHSEISARWKNQSSAWVLPHRIKSSILKIRAKKKKSEGQVLHHECGTVKE